jgi:hypothetical protein
MLLDIPIGEIALLALWIASAGIPRHSGQAESVVAP